MGLNLWLSLKKRSAKMDTPTASRYDKKVLVLSKKKRIERSEKIKMKTTLSLQTKRNFKLSA
jgi:hypothetical protein